MVAFRSVMLVALSAGALLPAAGSAAAQERRPLVRPKIVIEPDTVVRNKIRLVTQRRARLGVTVDLRASANDSVGATIDAVTPGGPAARAGIKSGDIITKLDGKLLAAAEGRKTGEMESLPGVRLIEIAAQLKPSQTVSVEYRRDGTRHTTSLVTGDEPIMTFEYPEWAGVQGRVMLPRTPGAATFGSGGTFGFAFGGPLMDLELAPLNEDLGQYFGTTEGVLVIDVPKESSLGVKAGDVIQSVDGRKITTPSSLHRILRSYDPGDSFKLEIMRQKSRMTVSGKLEQPREE
jgi:S1-C subfamily serine protease